MGGSVLSPSLTAAGGLGRLRYSLCAVTACSGLENRRMKKETLDKIRDKLLDRRRQLMGDFTNIQNNSLKRRDDASGDLSAMPIHMADIGSDTFEKEFALDLIESEQEELREIDAALERMADGSYGACEVCGAVLSYQRLMAVPYARLCVDCKRREEEEIA